jgi:hypothetical protein
VYFDILGTLWNSNWSRIFMAWIFLHKKQPKKKKHTSGPPDPKRAQVARSPGQTATPTLVWPSSLQCRSSSSQIDRLDLKNVYIKPPEVFPWESGGETWNHKNRGCSSEDWRGKRYRSRPPVTFPTSPTSPTPPPWWRGSSPPLDYCFVAVACSISLLCYDV